MSRGVGKKNKKQKKTPVSRAPKTEMPIKVL